MARKEDDEVNSSMDGEIVCISDDDECEAGPSTGPIPRRYGNHFNVYENSGYIAPSVQAQLKNSGANKPKQNQLEPLLQEDNAKDDVVYVLDDTEEEDHLIEPIRQFSYEIIFGNGLRLPDEFDYEKLKLLEKHLENKLKNVSFSTEKNIWNCALEQLAVMRTAYGDRLDVCCCCCCFFAFAFVQVNIYFD